MEYSLEVTVTKELIAIATRRFWLSYIGVRGVLNWLIPSLLLIVLAPFSGWSWMLPFGIFILLFLPLIWLVGYFQYVRRGVRRLNRMDSKQVSYRFSGQGMATRSDLGSGEVPWKTVDKIQCFPDVWLIYVGSRDYVYLPAAQMPREMQAFILEQTKTHAIRTL